MRTIKASEFKAKCLKIMDEVAATGEPVVVTKRGRAVARVEQVKAAAGARDTRKPSERFLGILAKYHPGERELDDAFREASETFTAGWEAGLDEFFPAPSAPGKKRKAA